jgi:hypothetical protein
VEQLIGPSKNDPGDPIFFVFFFVLFFLIVFLVLVAALRKRQRFE